MHSQPTVGHRVAVARPVDATVCGRRAGAHAPACGGDDDDAASDSSAAQSTDSSRRRATRWTSSSSAWPTTASTSAVSSPTAAADERPSIDQDAMQRAQEACGDLMPEGGAGDKVDRAARAVVSIRTRSRRGPTASPTTASRSTRLAKGDRPQTVTSPNLPADGERSDTPPDGERPDAGSMFGLDTTDPAVAAAMDACQDLQPDIGDGRQQIPTAPHRSRARRPDPGAFDDDAANRFTSEWCCRGISLQVPVSSLGPVSQNRRGQGVASRVPASPPTGSGCSRA